MNLVQNQILCIRKYHIILPRRGKWARVGKLKDRCDVPKGLWLLWIFSHPHLAPAFPSMFHLLHFDLCQEGFQSSLCQLFWFCILVIQGPYSSHTPCSLWPQLSCGPRNPFVSWRIFVFYTLPTLCWQGRMSLSKKDHKALSLVCYGL